MTELRQREPRIHEPGYLAWLRTRPCVACRRPPPCDAAHLRSASYVFNKRYTGKAEKPDDKWAVPLCRGCHMRQHAWGDELGWWVNQKIEPFKLCEKYHRNYREETGAPVMEVQRYRKKAKKVSRADQPKRQIQNRVDPWPKRSFSKKRATKQ